MVILKHELKQSRKSLFIWTVLISGMLAIALLIFPDMKNSMGDINEMFSSMWGFTEAFGMDKMNFGDIMGFYGVEVGNILGIGGGFFAAFIGISILSKEERDGTAEFLLTHPIKRIKVVLEKLVAVLVQLFILNIVVIVTAIISIKIIGESVEMKSFTLFHLAYFVLQVEIALICFGISAFIRRGNIGIGLGIAAIFYFMNVIKNISDKADFLKYITPFTYAEASEIVSSGKLDIKLIGLGLAYSLIALLIGFIKYNKKDIYV